MNIFASIFAHKVVAVAAAASLALGTSTVALAHNKDKNDVKKHETHQVKSTSSVDIAVGSKGRTLVHGATVTGVSGNTVQARTSWGTSVINWTVNTASTTKFLLKGEGKTTISSIAVGDTINFDGKLATTSAPFTVSAHIVRDTSR